ncbi:hypothetical protein HYV82_00170, partial [Candidatus Woesearchaeota archaeon]|nr:hypothetical protein [Candidatus Woesearchaeota archaeon]
MEYVNKYYESVLQLRSLREDIAAFVESEISRSRSKGVFVSSRERVKDGIDYYLSSNKFAVGLGRKLRKRFSGYLKVSRRIFSRDRQTSRDLYRITVLYRPLLVNAGDVVVSGSSIIRVSSVGKKIVGTNLESGKREYIGFSKEEPVVMKVETATVSKLYPYLEVISPETYQSIPLVGAGGKLSTGQKVIVAV